MKDLYWNIEIVLRMFVSIQATNCTAERFVFRFKKIEKWFTINYVARETKFLGHINHKNWFNLVIDDFKRINSKKHPK